MRIVYLAAGAGGMYCGSCLRDNRLAAALIAQGRDVVLVPLYTPLKTDEPDVSTGPVYYGGISVYLAQHSPMFRRAPSAVNRFLDSRGVLRRLGKLAGGVRAETLGPLTVSVLKGEDGAQRRQLAELIAGLRTLRPALVNLPNLMFVGMAREIGRALGVPVLCTLSGEDVFLDQLSEPHRGEAFRLIRDRGRDVAGYVAVTDYFAQRAAEHFGLPGERVHKVVMGIRPADFPEAAAPPAAPFTIGYLARICREEGLERLATAFVALRRQGRACRLRAAGYLAGADKPYLDAVRAQVRAAGVGDAFECIGEVDLAGKREFLRSLHVLSVPSVYPEAKGFYVLEAMASGVPVVQPAEGSFPELISATGGGVLYQNPPRHVGGRVSTNDPLADALGQLMDQPELRGRLAADGRRAVLRDFTDVRMAEQTWALYQQFVAAPAN